MAEIRGARYCVKQGLRGLILMYQRFLRSYLPSCCRFYPSCSDYALQALACYGIGKSLWLISRRLLRCHPLTEGGVDPLP